MNDTKGSKATPPAPVDGLLPPEIAAKAEALGVVKGNMPVLQVVLLSVLAGAFVALGCVFCTTALTGAETLPYGVKQMLGGFAFCLALILIVVAGAELFTGNNLLVMAVVSRRLPVSKLLLNWVLVYAGNFIGSIVTAALIYITAQYAAADGAVGAKAIEIAQAKCQIPFGAALMRGVYCNALVCLAVWLCYSCRTTTDKVVAILFPITAFSAAGFEHCVANMYFIPFGIFVSRNTDFVESLDLAARPGLDVLTWGNFVTGNLIPVTIGNIIGGAVFVGVVYWLVYCLPRHRNL